MDIDCFTFIEHQGTHMVGNISHPSPRCGVPYGVSERFGRDIRVALVIVVGLKKCDCFRFWLLVAFQHSSSPNAARVDVVG